MFLGLSSLLILLCIVFVTSDLCFQLIPFPRALDAVLSFFRAMMKDVLNLTNTLKPKTTHSWTIEQYALRLPSCACCSHAS